MSIEAYGIVPDSHLPYESKVFYTAFRILRDVPNLKGIYFLGDLVEFESISRWAKHPDGYNHLRDEIGYTLYRLKDIRRIFPKLPITWILGNHEARLSKFLMDIPQLWGIEDLSIRSLFLLDELNISTVDYNPTQLCRIGNTETYARHEPRGKGQFCAKQTAEKSGINTLFGHTHTRQYYEHRLYNKIVFAASNGWLGDHTKEIFNYRDVNACYSKNVSILYHDSRFKKDALEMIDLNQDEGFFHGKIYR